MLPGMNQKQMAQAMKKMGVQQIEIPATEVIIRTADKEIIITEPNVSKVKMMGQESFQITGNIHEREKDSTPDISEEDIKTVMEQANVSEEDAKKALEKTSGNLAEAVLKLSE